MAVEAESSTASTGNLPPQASVAATATWWRGGHPSYQIAKRALDIMISSVALVATAPIMLVAALAIRLESEGPVLFRQLRIGKDGSRFFMWKFRGMYADAEERFPHLYEYVLTRDQLAHAKFHDESDPRVTRVGRFLRRTSIDELPNLWNVLRGEMSLVGPRPDIPEMLPYYGESLGVFLAVLPGVTSLAKATGRDSWSFDHTLELDLEYVRKRSLLLDINILARTCVVVITRRGAS